MSLLKRLEKEKTTTEEPVQEMRVSRIVQPNDPWKDFKNQVHHEVIQTMDTSEADELEADTLQPIIEDIVEKSGRPWHNNSA